MHKNMLKNCYKSILITEKSDFCKKMLKQKRDLKGDFLKESCYNCFIIVK